MSHQRRRRGINGCGVYSVLRSLRSPAVLSVDPDNSKSEEDTRQAPRPTSERQWEEQHRQNSRVRVDRWKPLVPHRLGCPYIWPWSSAYYRQTVLHPSQQEISGSNAPVPSAILLLPPALTPATTVENNMHETMSILLNARQPAILSCFQIAVLGASGVRGKACVCVCVMTAGGILTWGSCTDHRGALSPLCTLRPSTGESRENGLRRQYCPCQVALTSS